MSPFIESHEWSAGGSWEWWLNYSSWQKSLSLYRRQKPKCLLGSQLEKYSPVIMKVIRCVPGPLHELPCFFRHLPKVPCADKCLINKIKKRFGCSINPSPRPFSFCISRLISFSGQIFLPRAHSLSFVVEPMWWFSAMTGWEPSHYLLPGRFPPCTITIPLRLKHRTKSTVDILSPFLSQVHCLLQNGNIQKLQKIFSFKPVCDLRRPRGSFSCFVVNGCTFWQWEW